MAEGKLFIQKDSGEYVPLGEVKEVDLSEMETVGKYEPNAPYLDMSSLPVTVTLNLADIDWCALIRSTFGSLKKYTMMARRAAKKAARLKRKEFYLARCRRRAWCYNNHWFYRWFKYFRKLPLLPEYKWSIPLEDLRIWADMDVMQKWRDDYLRRVSDG